MASDLNKPNGQAVITPRAGPGFVEALPVKKFHGVGPATAAKMEGLGILTGADLKAKPLPFLQEHFGKSGAWYYRIARGIDERAVQPDRPRKSIGAEDTFAVDVVDLEPAREKLGELAEKVWRHCEGKSVRGRTVTVKIKFSDFEQITRSRTAESPIASLDDLKAASEWLLGQAFPFRRSVRLLGVTISTFDDEQHDSSNQLQLEF